ncbi:hypothetical protein OF364_00580 [Mycoplasma enhydrae]|uniref:hypothetical protein n=1 Tax=Mycoplasma enhydrae TaxID=2499220 RepID=UPI0021E82484|nr:hypothetical protein [Mycoplasma enhydrae]MCV3733438.1 hypothetical protein [Mycoplasma enhydrae]MCV3753314.1 hypothetical protein [Mycoplasma enhydrae]
MNKEIDSKIKNWISSIAGVIDFETLDEFNEINTPNDGIVVLKSEKQKNAIDVYIGLITLVSISAKNIVEEIYQIINYNLKKINWKIGKLCVYIKGTK